MAIFEDDFENGLIPYTTTLTDGNDIAAVVTAVKHHGYHSLQSTIDVLGHFASATKTFTTTYDLLYCRCRAYINNLPTNANYNKFMALTNPAENNAVMGVYNNAGTYRLSISTPTNNFFQNISITAQSWHEFQLYILRNAVTGAVKGWYDDTLMIDQSNTDTGDFAVQEMELGNFGQSGDANTVYIDCVKVDIQKISADVNQPIVYEADKIVVEEAKSMPSCYSGVTDGQSARVRTVRHLTPISPWTAQ